MILSGHARFAGVMGWPVAHSRSPHIHGYWLEEKSIDGTYLPLAVRPEALGTALAALPVLGFRGCNLTVPHKEAAIAHVHSLSEMARQIGAVNTVTVGPDGKLYGDNTDAYGFISHLRDKAPGWLADRPVTILGSGGSARAVIAALVGAGVSEIRLLNRTAGRAADLAEAFGSIVRPMPWDENQAALEQCGLLINTTTLGMAGQPPLEISLEPLPQDAAVYDLVYAPLETGLLRAARERGNPVVDGLGMLIYQARPGFTAWFGADPEITAALWSFVAEGL